MLRTAALAAAGLGPSLGRRLLSAAATQAVPAPNQQPEVFYNQVRTPAPGLCSLGEKEPAGWKGPGSLWAPVDPVGARGVCSVWALRTSSFPSDPALGRLFVLVQPQSVFLRQLSGFRSPPLGLSRRSVCTEL